MGALVVAAPAAGAATKSVAVGPNGKLSPDKKTVTLAVKIKCDGGATMLVQGKVKQGTYQGKGTSTVKCTKGETKSVTVDAVSTAPFSTGDGQACVAVGKKGGNNPGAPVCRDVQFIT